MRRYFIQILIVLVLALVLSVGCGSPEIPSISSAAAKVSPAIVLIVTDTGSGTGMFISSDGYVLTNEHVVSKGYYATLNLPDGRSVEAEILYRDPNLDIAILKVAGGNYPVVILGSTTEPTLGEDVVALGYPSAAQLGESVSLSKGIVSAFRTIGGVNYIQTDASLNPGSSGGPLVNIRGEVIGMNSLKLREGEGISLAIKLNDVKTRIQSIVQQHIDGRLAVLKPPVPEPPVEKTEEKAAPSAPPKGERVEWSKTFGGAGDDRGYSVQQTSDGGYIIAGTTESFGVASRDVYLVKTDASGNMLWSQTYGGAWADFAHSAEETSDGGYIIAGSKLPVGAHSYNAYLIKTDSSGNEAWSKTFGGADDTQGLSVQQTSDGGYIIAGSKTSSGASSNDVYLVKTDYLGAMLWSEIIGSTGSDGGLSVRQTVDGGYIITGYYNVSPPYGHGDVYLVKLRR